MAGGNFELTDRRRSKKAKPIRFKDLILFEDERVIVVNKPAGLSSLSDREQEVHLQGLGQAYCAEATLAHRLDTSREIHSKDRVLGCPDPKP